jgi:hypothetical protein
MNERTVPNNVNPGMAVFGSDGELLGPIEAISNEGAIRVLTHVVPAMAIAYVDSAGVHLHVAKAAFAALPPDTRDAATVEA